MKSIAHKVHAYLLPLIEGQQAETPDRLVTTARITQEAASILNVTRASLGKYLTCMVSDGRLIEILVRRDWRVQLPEHWDEEFYAVVDGEAYRLDRERPESRGANGNSFLITPDDYKRFLSYVLTESDS
jgi:hypothetical protein